MVMNEWISAWQIEAQNIQVLSVLGGYEELLDDSLDDFLLSFNLHCYSHCLFLPCIGQRYLQVMSPVNYIDKSLTEVSFNVFIA